MVYLLLKCLSKKEMPTKKLDPAQNYYCLQCNYIANAAIKQITKRNKLDVFQLFAINHGSSSTQPIHMPQ